MSVFKRTWRSVLGAVSSELHSSHTWSEVKQMCEHCGVTPWHKRAREQCAYLSSPGDIQVHRSVELVMFVCDNDDVRAYSAGFVSSEEPQTLRISFSRAHRC